MSVHFNLKVITLWCFGIGSMDLHAILTKITAFELE